MTLRMAVLVALRVALLAAVAHFVYLALGAPIPVKKRVERAKTPAIVGEWTIYWQGARGEVAFYAEGDYTCKWCEQQWVGGWRIKDGVLIVNEARESPLAELIPKFFTWQASLDATGLAGALQGGGTFRLEKRKP